MSRAQIRKERRKGDYLSAAGAIVAAMALAAVVTGFLLLSRQLSDANEARDQLAAQVQALGATPVAGPPGSRGGPGDVGPSGPPGEDGKNGSSGDDGSPGRAGASGPPGADGSDGSPGPAGSDGSDGAKGADGTDGSDGAPGPAGPPGPEGPKGEQGEKGDKGDKGEDGEAGATCPDGYSPQAPSYDPDALVCRRDGAPDPAPTDGQSGSDRLLGLAPDRRKY